MTLHRTTDPDFAPPPPSGSGSGPTHGRHDGWSRRRRKSGPLRISLLALLGAALTWLVTSHTLVAYLADSAPENALRIARDDPQALLNAADERLTKPKQGSPLQSPARAETPSRATELVILADIKDIDIAELRDRVERALAADPTSARAIRILGQLTDLGGDQARATTLLEAAARRSKHESVATYLMVQRNLERQDWPAALFYADILMRSRHDLVQAVSPLMVRIAETPAAQPLVIKTLASNPVWRRSFMFSMLASVTDARTPLAIHIALKQAASPAAVDELAAYLDFLINHQLHEIAYYAWLQFLPPEKLAAAGYVFNGGFEAPASGLPFDWTLARSMGAMAQIAPPPGENGNHALRIEFGTGRVQLGDIQQRLLLAAGNYRLSGRYRGEIAARRGIRWTISCAGRGNDKIGETPALIGIQPTWRPFDVAFTIPDNCRSQVLRVTHDGRFSAEQFVSGHIWYDDIRIVRSEGGE